MVGAVELRMAACCKCVAFVACGPFVGRLFESDTRMKNICAELVNFAAARRRRSTCSSSRCVCEAVKVRRSRATRNATGRVLSASSARTTPASSPVSHSISASSLQRVIFRALSCRSFVDAENEDGEICVRRPFSAAPSNDRRAEPMGLASRPLMIASLIGASVGVPSGVAIKTRGAGNCSACGANRRWRYACVERKVLLYASPFGGFNTTRDHA